MKITSPLRPDLSKVKDQSEINEKLLFSQNKNFETLFKLLQKGVGYDYNMDGTLISSMTVYHNASINIPHKLPRYAKNMIILWGDNAVKGVITSAGRNSSVGKFWLPSAVFLKNVGSDFWVSDTDGFNVGDEVRIGSSSYKIATISGSKVTFESDPSVTVFEDSMYIFSTTVNIFVF